MVYLKKTRIVVTEMVGLTCRVGAHNSRYAHDTRLYPMRQCQQLYARGNALLRKFHMWVKPHCIELSTTLCLL